MTDKPPEISALLIPMLERPMLLPNSAVAEVVPFSQIVPISNKGGWYLGKMSWRNINVPIVAFEKLNRQQWTGPDANSRLAIINGSYNDKDVPYYAIVVQGVPKLVKLTPGEVFDEDVEVGPAESNRVQAAGEEAFIPNLEAIEGYIIEASQ